MSAYDAPLEIRGAGDSLASEAVPADLPWSERRLFPKGTTPERVILKRGSQGLVLFRGHPEPGLLQAFLERRMIIGLALTREEFRVEGWIEHCGYALIGSDDRPGSTFAAALRDLVRAGWSVDHEIAWPVIDGGYAGAVAEQPERRPSSLRPARSVTNAERRDLPELQNPQRVEA